MSCARAFVLGVCHRREPHGAFHTPTPPPPTPGAGKTNVAVLCILHQLGLHRGADGEIDKAAFKIVYIAPMKARLAWAAGGG